MYTCRHFLIKELIPPDLSHPKQWAALWRLFDDRLLRAADLLRDEYGPMTVNDWIWGGGYTDSGLRLPGSEYYSFTSQHSHGRALDLKPQDAEVQRIREDIIGRKKSWMGLITGVELDVEWLHIDTRNAEELHMFRP